MLADIVPAQVAADEGFEDVLDAALFPEEEAVLARAVDKRRREFTTARACARAGLARLGVPPVPILPGLRGAPQWPPGIVGSMTHCAGYRASAVARADDMLTLGLDAEPDDRLPDGVLDVVATADEQAALDALAHTAPTPSWDRLLFMDGRRLTGFTGRWLARDGLLLTAIAVPRCSPPGRWNGPPS